MRPIVTALSRERVRTRQRVRFGAQLRRRRSRPKGVRKRPSVFKSIPLSPPISKSTLTYPPLPAPAKSPHSHERGVRTRQRVRFGATLRRRRSRPEGVRKRPSVFESIPISLPIPQKPPTDPPLPTPAKSLRHHETGFEPNRGFDAEHRSADGAQRRPKGEKTPKRFRINPSLSANCKRAPTHSPKRTYTSGTSRGV